MRPRYAAVLARWQAVVGLAAAAVLAVGISLAGPAAAASQPTPSGTTSPAPSVSPGSTTTSPSLSTSPGAHGITCTINNVGHLADCAKPVAKSKLPAGAKNNATLAQPVTDIASMVDTRTWTSGGGNTYPGADVPFGMVQWSPDTSPDRNAGGGYGFGDTSLIGYSLTHISGPGCGAAGDVPILPMTGALPGGNPNRVQTSFTNTGETAQAGYYSAQSNGPDNTITSEFTATPHTSMGQFTFPSTTSADFLIKLQDSQNGDFGDSAQIVGNNEVTGSDTSGDFCGESNNDGQVQHYTVHFDIVFSQPFTASQVITASGQTTPRAVFLTFDTTSNPVVDAKVAISYVSTANAQLDLQTENPGWDFGSVKTAAQTSWNNLLGKIQVSGGTAAQTQEFYSLLYKDFMQPNISSDVNGQYTGSDMQTHTISAPQQDQYGTFSGWDIYHSLSQLQAMLDPQAASDQAQSLLNYYSQDQLLQQWGYLNLNNYVMVGDPAQSIIADYYAFGARSFNTGEALTDMLKQATTVNDVRPGEALEQQYGYLPADGSYGCCNPHGMVATLLEYDTEDLALSQFARALGDSSDAAMLEARANNWQNQFDVANGLLNPRNENGQFVPGVVPTFPDNNELYYVEGDAYEYLWNTPNDYAGLFSLMGGDSNVVPALTQYLSQPNGFGMFAQLSNEFDFGEQYALNYAGDPAGTQQAVNTMLTTMFPPGPSGLPNNDDLGANSSTFIWQMLGMYPENSGSDTLVFSGPHFPHASIALANGHTITINAPAASASNYYVQNLKVNGNEYQKLYVPFSTLAQGATLDWNMGSTPSDWGNAPQDAPPSYTAGLRSAVGFLGSQQVTVAPGASTTVQIGAHDAASRAQAVQASVSAPAGLSATPGSGTLHVPMDGADSINVTITAGSSTPQTFYSVPVTFTTASGSTQSLTLLVLVAQPGSLLSTYNNSGISDDGGVSGQFDDSGFSYSEQALAGAGLAAGQPVMVGGVEFTWPLPGPGFPDNVIAGGQQVTVNAPAGTQTLGFLGAATNGPSEGVTTLHYSDGSSAQYWLGLSDWTLNGGSASQPSFGNLVAAHMSYRDCMGCSGHENVGTNVFYTGLPVDPTKTLTSITLPNGADQGNLHVFAIGTSAQPLSPPGISSLSPATASAGQQVTINGSGFGATQGSGYVAFSDNGVNWGAPGNAAPFQIDSWSDTAITFTVPTPAGPGGVWSVAPGTPASVTVVNSAGGMSDSPVLQITPTANPADYYDNAGTSPDNNQACADFDGGGFTYSATALANAGLTPGATVTADGLTFTWPNVAACSPDNILAAGQTMLMSPVSGASTLGLLGSSSDGGSQGTIVINYTDGTSSTATVSFNDWASAPGGGDTAVATMPYRNSASGTSQGITMYVFATTVSVDSSKTVASITFPDVSNQVGQTAMHIFAVSLGG
ncbi:MAG TPA: GH92 family glycosyl hydrolase [Streptosporangiaceae bacterium]|nr:GH92 family glycosyl hydrolase [Streptosporangiaceae bacterium]